MVPKDADPRRVLAGKTFTTNTSRELRPYREKEGRGDLAGSYPCEPGALEELKVCSG